MLYGNKKRLLFVATRQFWPPSSGKEVTLFHNCKGLYERYGYEVYLFCFADKKTDKKRTVPAFISDVKYVDVPGIKKQAFRILWKSILSNQWPIQNSLFFDTSIAIELKRYYEFVNPTALIIDMVRLAPYADVLPNDSIPHILIEDDLLAKRYRRQLKTAGQGNISGYMSNSLSDGFNKFLNSGLVREMVLRGEIRRLEKYESGLPDKFDYITFISPIESREYNEKYGTNKGMTLTMGADVGYFSEGTPNEHIQGSLSVVGNYSYGSNAASIEWICEKVLPLLPEEIRYYVIGNFPQELKQKLNNPRVVSLGYVDDIRSVVKSTDVYLSPVVFGTGIKTKVVEAMAMGMPVVTNSVGAEGLDVQNGVQLFIEDEPEEMARIVSRLLSDKELREKVGKAGQAFVKKFHNWDVVYNAFGEMGL